jgi:hypothetical protein
MLNPLFRERQTRGRIKNRSVPPLNSLVKIYPLFVLGPQPILETPLSGAKELDQQVRRTSGRMYGLQVLTSTALEEVPTTYI